MTEQERFETWAANRPGYGTAGSSPDWSLGAVREAWKVWQAARADKARLVCGDCKAPLADDFSCTACGGSPEDVDSTEQAEGLPWAWVDDRGRTTTSQDVATGWAEDSAHVTPLAPILALRAPRQATEDTRRLDWLESKTVNVRTPLRYGSRNLFWAGPSDDDGVSIKSDLRERIDDAAHGIGILPASEKPE
jgi:hypothetical protein